MTKRTYTIFTTFLAALAVLSYFYFASDKKNSYLEKDGWRKEKGYFWKALEIPAEGNEGFTKLLPEKTGIDFINSVTDSQSAANRIVNNGSGVATGDIDDDGLSDIYFSRLNGANVLYKNLGNWKFEDITQMASVELKDQFSMGANLADIDGDNDLDLFVTGLGTGVRLFINDGKGKFFENTKSAGLLSKFGSTSISLADIEGDGDLDLYIANYREKTLKDYGGSLKLKMVNGKLTVPPNLSDRIAIVDGQLKELGEPDLLYINDGKGNFSIKSWTDGSFLDEDGNKLKKPPLDWGLSVIFKDIDNDLDPDIYLSNDFESPDRFWINDGRGNFQAIKKLALRTTSATSMGADFADIDRDGDYDFYVVDMLSRDHKLRKMQMGTMKPTPTSIGEIDNRPQIMRNTLFLNRDDNTYAEIAYLSGLHATEWSWAPVFFDVDLDGFEDLIVTNGHSRDVQDTDTIEYVKSLDIKDPKKMRETYLLYPRLETENLAFKNLGNLKFEDKSKNWGIDSKGISHGIALADFDNDGDLDLVINNLDSAGGVYRNDAAKPRVAVRLLGLSPNNFGIGAKVKLIGGPVDQAQEMISGGRYLSSSDPVLVFAAGEAQNLKIEVEWRSGKKSVIKNVKPNRIYVIDENYSEEFQKQKPENVKPIFKDASSLISHRHHENEFDDFRLQPLLPNRLSQLGPGVAWYDYDDDGDEDLFITSGKGGSLSVFENKGNESFGKLDFGIKAKADLTTPLLLKDKDVKLLVGSSSFEDKKTESVVSFNLSDSKSSMEKAISGNGSSSGPIAMADIDSDGDLDLFIGGRVISGRYPEAASSAMYLNSNGDFVLDTQNIEALSSIGLVTGAVFSDLDNDNDPDLVLSTEWGPVKLFVNEKGKLKDSTEDFGFSEFLGWWNGVTTGDLNGDGKPDIVATNWGMNHKYHFDKDNPLHIYYNDFDNDGVLDIVEAHYDEKMEKLVPERGLSCSSDAMPFIKREFPKYEDFGGAGIIDIYGEDNLERSQKLTANHLEHTLFINKGDSFEISPLPLEAQLSPAFGVNITDFDNDGNEDVFITQNFFATQIETPRSDAGRSLLMLGDGEGGLKPVPGHISGILVYGDSRSSATGDFNNDGKVDLVVTQNGADTKLFENQTEKHGLRVKLIGPDSNPDAIGSKIRLFYEEKAGPLREIQAGSGYWSLNSKVQIFSVENNPTDIEVVWPSGKKITKKIDKTAKELEIIYSQD